MKIAVQMAHNENNRASMSSTTGQVGFPRPQEYPLSVATSACTSFEGIDDSISQGAYSASGQYHQYIQPQGYQGQPCHAQSGHQQSPIVMVNQRFGPGSLQGATQAHYGRNPVPIDRRGNPQRKLPGFRNSEYPLAEERSDTMPGARNTRTMLTLM